MYPTRDKVIPHKLFQLLYREMWTGVAFNRLNTAYAFRLGTGWSNVPDKSGFRKELRQERKTAGMLDGS